MWSGTTQHATSILAKSGAHRHQRHKRPRYIRYTTTSFGDSKDGMTAGHHSFTSFTRFGHLKRAGTATPSKFTSVAASHSCKACIGLLPLLLSARQAGGSTGLAVNVDLNLVVD